MNNDFYSQINGDKGQGLPITTVVLVIAVLVVLVMVLYFIILPILNFHTPPSPTNNLTLFTQNCQRDCGLSTQTSISSSPFCTDSTSYNGQTLHCYSQTSTGYVYDSGECTYQASNGTYVVADSHTC